MAAALTAHALGAEPAPLSDLTVLSSGVSAYDGDRVSANSVAALKKVGLDIADHVSRRLTQEMVNDALAIFGMTESHRALLGMQFDVSTPHVYLMREFLDSPEREIPDPFGYNFQAYEMTRDSMVEAIPSLTTALKKIKENPETPLL